MLQHGPSPPLLDDRVVQICRNLTPRHGAARALCVAGVLIFAATAIGLNIVVGYAGLLDLGYAAFFAIGAYLTALALRPWLLVPVMMLSRNVLGVHYPTDTLAGAALGAATAKVAIEAEKRI